MLDRNPSYIKLCEQLERMDLRLDRAIFAKTLLTAVPDVNSTSRMKSTQGLLTSQISGTTALKLAVAPIAVMKRDPGTPRTPAAGPYDD